MTSTLWLTGLGVYLSEREIGKVTENGIFLEKKIIFKLKSKLILWFSLVENITLKPAKQKAKQSKASVLLTLLLCSCEGFYLGTF